MKKEHINEKVKTDNYWLTEYNWKNEVRDQYNLPDKVQIHDATLREGQQTPGVILKEDEQVRIAQALNDLGVDRIEVIPKMSDEDKRATKSIMKLGLDTKILAFCSWNKEDIDLALECGVDGIILDYVGNPWQAKVFWGMKPEEIVEKGVNAAKYAKKHGLYISALIWDDMKAPEDFLKLNYKSIVEEGGVDAVCLADTFGFSMPWTMKYMVEKIKTWIPNTPIELHIHNDFGMATALSLSGVAGGASIVDTAILGLGERCGNAPTEEVALALELILGIKTSIKLDKIYETCKIIQKISRFKIGSRKPLVGENAFKFSSGWIYWMQKKAEKAGEIQGMLPYKPEFIGRPGSEYVIDKSIGKALLKDKLDKLGIAVSDKEDLIKIMNKIKEESSVTKSIIEDFELKKIAENILLK